MGIIGKSRGLATTKSDSHTGTGGRITTSASLVAAVGPLVDAVVKLIH
ncbi:MAG: hypothetical protein QOD62_2647 [Actinomycetota bacterium]|nr:hypothetical protein [Actinomycetota bacterium]